MLSRSLKMAFWVTYDHTGKLIVSSVLWSVLPAVPLYFAWTAVLTGDPRIVVRAGLPCAYLGVGILMPVLSAGIAHMIKILIDTRDGELRDLFRGIGLYARKAALLGSVYFMFGVCLVTSAWFYGSWLHTSFPLLGYSVAALALWCLFFLGLTAIYAIPALVQKKGSVRETLRLAAALCVGNPGLTLGLAAQLICLALLSLAMLPVYLCLFGGVAIVLCCSAYELLARKYQRLQAPAGSEVAILDDSQDDYLNRGFRDFLFPWKG